MQNCLASYGTLKDQQGCKINWNYTEHLHKLQEYNFQAKDFKAPMRPSKEAVWEHFLEEAKLYLSSLTDDKGLPMYQTKQ